MGNIRQTFLQLTSKMLNVFIEVLSSLTVHYSLPCGSEFRARATKMNKSETQEASLRSFPGLAEMGLRGLPRI